MHRGSFLLLYVVQFKIKKLQSYEIVDIVFYGKRLQYLHMCILVYSRRMLLLTLHSINIFVPFIFNSAFEKADLLDLTQLTCLYICSVPAKYVILFYFRKQNVGYRFLTSNANNCTVTTFNWQLKIKVFLTKPMNHMAWLITSHNKLSFSSLCFVGTVVFTFSV